MTLKPSTVVPQPRSDLDLPERIARRRHEILRYLAKATRRRRRLFNITILAGTAAAMLTAAPALGGQPFTQWLAGTLGLSTPAWQFLCTAAAVCSMTGTVATQLLRSDNLEEHIAKAQAVPAKLEILDIGLAAGQLGSDQATGEYFRCILDCPFVPSDPTGST